MTHDYSPVNPLFTVPAAPGDWSPRHACARAAKIGGFGGIAVAAWLATAVATGYGVAVADETSTPSESTSTSAESSSSTAEPSDDTTTSATTPSADSSSGDGSPEEATVDSTTSTATGSTSSTTEVAPGVTVSSSGGAQSGAQEGALDDTDVDAQPQPTETPSADEDPDGIDSETPSIDSTAAPKDSGSTAAVTQRQQAVSTAPSTSATTVVANGTDGDADDQTAMVTVSAPAPSARALTHDVVIASSTMSTVNVPAAQATAPPTGFVGLLNNIVTSLLNPFLESAPNTGDPFTPIAWAVLGWVRRNLFNQSPVVTMPTAISQTGQTVTGKIDVADPEGDALTYTVTKRPERGTLTIDQATGTFTYTPDDIDYTAMQKDSFTVSVTDGKLNLLNLFGSRTVRDDVDIDVLSPTVERVILAMPDGVTKPVNPRYSADGQSIYFSGTPAAGGRSEIYKIDIDGSDATCVTCGLAGPTIAASDPSLPVNLRKPVPFYDGSGRVVVLLDNPEPRYAIYEPAGYNGVGSPARIVNVFTEVGGGASLPGLPFPNGIINREREMRPSPDGTHVLFTRIVIGQTGNFQALPIVGALTANGDHYDVTNAKVVWPTGESKQWTPDGKGVIIQGGAFEAGNIDDIMVDLSGQTGESLYPGDPIWKGVRVTGNLDYDEDIDMSPNKQWITVGSLRGLDALTPMTRIVRQNFLPVYLAAIYDQYADNQVRNVSNQNWAIAIEDDLNREDGIPLFVQDDPATVGVDEGDGWISRSMPSWNADGTAVTFWESGNGDEHGIAPSESRIVIANLKYTTSVGTAGDTTTVVNSSAFPDLTTYVAKPTPLPPIGTYNGVQGGTATVTESFDSTTRQTTRTVVYENYVNEDGLILNGTESSAYGPSQLSVTYLADIDVTDATGAQRGNLDADAVVTLLPTQSVSGFITSTLDGDTQTIPDPEKVEAAKTGA